MVIYDLVCKKNHRFEGWFPSLEGYEEQLARNQVSCPVCGSTKISKLPHACAVHTKREAPVEPPAVRSAKAEARVSPEDVKEALLRLHHHVREHFDNVGDGFADEARKIHRGEADDRPIYGTMTNDQREELNQDGVPYVVLPKPDLDS